MELVHEEMPLGRGAADVHARAAEHEHRRAFAMQQLRDAVAAVRVPPGQPVTAAAACHAGASGHVQLLAASHARLLLQAPDPYQLAYGPAVQGILRASVPEQQFLECRPCPAQHLAPPQHCPALPAAQALGLPDPHSLAHPAAPVQRVPFSAAPPEARLDPHHRDAQPDLDAPGGSEIDFEPAPASP